MVVEWWVFMGFYGIVSWVTFPITRVFVDDISFSYWIITHLELGGTTLQNNIFFAGYNNIDPSCWK